MSDAVKLLQAAHRAGSGGMVVRPSGKTTFVRNLGWLLKQAGRSIIRSVEVVEPVPGVPRGAGLVVTFDDGTVYANLWASSTVLWQWLDRPVLHDAPAVWNDTDLGLTVEGVLRKGLASRPKGLLPNPLTSAKARKMLRDGTAHGRPLTEKQRRYFGAVASGYARRENPADGLTLAQARKLLPKYDLSDIVRATRPRDRDKLLAEAAHRHECRRNPDDDLRRLERAAGAGDKQAKKRLKHARERAGILYFKGRRLPSGVTLRRGPDFSKYGHYVLTVDGEDYSFVYRDPASRKWHLAGAALLRAERANRSTSYFPLGDTVEEMVETLRSRAARKSNPLPRAAVKAMMKKPLGHQQGGKLGQVPFAEAVERFKLDKQPGFAKALKAYRRFHGTDPDSVTVMTYPGQGSKVVVRMGEVPETHYLGPDNSNKKNTHWVHKHRERGKGKNPDLLFDPETGLMTIAGGTFKVTRWIYH